MYLVLKCTLIIVLITNINCTLSRISVKECGDSIVINCPISSMPRAASSIHRWTRNTGNNPMPIFDENSYSTDSIFNNNINNGKISFNYGTGWYNMTINNLNVNDSAYYRCSWSGHFRGRFIVQHLLIVVCPENAHRSSPIYGSLNNRGEVARRILLPCTARNRYENFEDSMIQEPIKFWVRKQLHDHEYDVLTTNGDVNVNQESVNSNTYSYIIKRGEIAVAGTYYCMFITPTYVLQSTVNLIFPDEYL